MSTKKKVAFHTLGCKLNFTETSTIARSFLENGFELTDFSKKADFYVINTCSVTDNADKKFKNVLNRAKKATLMRLILLLDVMHNLSLNQSPRSLELIWY